MTIFERLSLAFGTSLNKKERAIAFVDYEHWYYSYRNMFHIPTNVLAWRRELDGKFQLEDVMIFGDFSRSGINDDLNKLRSITNSVISTAQPKAIHKKDMTDFVMLDYIYQTAALRPEIKTYILFTGDGHFQSVTKYLVQKLRKQVIIYGVLGATSARLKDVATEIHELPATHDVVLSHYKMVIQNMVYASKRDIITTFRGTANAVAKRYDIPQTEAYATIRDMLDKGFLVWKQRRVDFNRTVKVIAADWEKLIQAGLWEPETQVASSPSQKHQSAQ